MRARILFFSVLRDLAGSDSLEVNLGDEATLADLVGILHAKIPGLAVWEGRLLLAVNGEYADRTTVLGDGDEIALMPPVQGG